MTARAGRTDSDSATRLPVTGRLRIGSNDDLVRLNEAAWQVLERTGFKIYSKRLLDKVAALGAAVDYGTMVARFPRTVLEETLDCRLRPEPPDQPMGDLRRIAPLHARPQHDRLMSITDTVYPNSFDGESRA